MPYIAPENRPEMDRVVELMKEVGVQANGDLNYILYKYCKETVKPGYGRLKNYCGELRQCATEVERRILGPYENECITRNGDV